MHEITEEADPSMLAKRENFIRRNVENHFKEHRIIKRIRFDGKRVRCDEARDIQRNDVDHLKNQFLDLIIMKLWVPQSLGKIGGDLGKKELMRLYDKATLATVMKDWIESDTVKKYWPDTDRLLAHIRGGIAYGLIYLQDPEAYDFVKKQYEEGLIEYKQTKVSTPLWDNLVYAMGLKDCIDEIGLEAMLNMDYMEKMDLTRSYMYKYDPRLKKTAQPHNRAVKYTPAATPRMFNVRSSRRP